MPAIVKITADISDLKKRMDELGFEFKQLQSGADSFSSKSKKGFSSVEAQIKDLTVQMGVYQRSIEKATNPQQAEKYRQKLKQIEAELKELNTASKGHKEQWQTFSQFIEGKAVDAFKKLGATITAAYAAEKVKEFIVSSVEAYQEAEKAEIALRGALGQRENATKNMIGFAKQMQKETIVEDDLIVKNMAKLIGMGLTQKQTQEAVTAALNVSAARGEDFNSVLDTIAATYKGVGRGAASYDKEIKGLTAEQLKNGEAVNLLNDRYKGFAATLAETTSGQIEQAKNAYGDYKEAVGGAFSELLKDAGILESFTEGMRKQTAFLEDEYIPAWKKVTSELMIWGGGSQEIYRNLAQSTEQLSEQIAGNILKISEKTGKSIEQVKIDLEKEQGMSWSRILFPFITDSQADKEIEHGFDVLRERTKKNIAKLKEALGDQANVMYPKQKELSDEEKKAQQKAYDEILAANEEMHKKITQIEIEITNDKLKQLILQRKAEIDEINKSKADAEHKGLAILAINKKYAKLLNDYKLEIKVDLMPSLGVGETDTKKSKEEIVSQLEKLQEVIETEVELADEKLKKKLSGKKDRKATLFDTIIGSMIGSDDFTDIDNAKKLIGDQVSQMLSTSLDMWSQYNKSIIDIRQNTINEYDRQIEENRSLLEQENKDRAAGYASNVDKYKQRDEELRKLRAKAVEDSRKRQKEQMIIDSIGEASSIAVAVANNFKNWSTIPFVGQVMAIVNSALLVASFAFTKAKLFSEANNTPQLAHGGTGVLGGRSHQQGGTPFLGGYEAEAGERWAVFSRKATRENSGLDQFVTAINTGKLFIDKDKIIQKKNNHQSGIVVNFTGGKDLSGIHRIMKKNDGRETVTPDGYIQIGNSIVKRKILNK